MTVSLNYQPGAGPDVNVQTLTIYDAAGNRTWQRDSLGRWTFTEYDVLNRLKGGRANQPACIPINTYPTTHCCTPTPRGAAMGSWSGCATSKRTGAGIWIRRLRFITVPSLTAEIKPLPLAMSPHGILPMGHCLGSSGSAPH